MDDPIGRPSVPVRLRRTCECNRLEKQFLIDAYECLVAVLAQHAHHGGEDEGCREPAFQMATSKARPSKATAACGK